MIDNTFGKLTYSDISKILKKCAVIGCTPNKLVMDCIDFKLREEVADGFKDWCAGIERMEAGVDVLTVMYRNKFNCTLDVITINKYDIQGMSTGAILSLEQIIAEARVGEENFNKNKPAIMNCVNSIRREIVKTWCKESIAVLIKNTQCSIRKNTIKMYTNQGTMKTVGFLEEMKESINIEKSIQEHMRNVSKLNTILQDYCEQENMRNMCSFLHNGVGIVTNINNRLHNGADVTMEVKGLKKAGAHTVFVLS